jgi:hypothetical protein
MGLGVTAREVRTLNVVAGAGALVWMSVGPALAADIPAALGTVSYRFDRTLLGLLFGSDHL